MNTGDKVYRVEGEWVDDDEKEVRLKLIIVSYRILCVDLVNGVASLLGSKQRKGELDIVFGRLEDLHETKEAAETRRNELFVL